ncbi:MAG: DNA repair protein [Sphingobacteriales bacterium]|nr:MAG: DNA repair protein [Sphingobacteriales bacterium]
MEKPFNRPSLFQVSEISVSYRPNFRASQRPKITSSREAFDILMDSWDLDRIELQEQFKIILLNRANRVMGIYEVSSGGISGTLADPKLIFGTALKCCASGLILVHNHPSGNLVPSQEDSSITRKLQSAAALLDIHLHDHLIICSEGYYSFADEGMI